MKENDKEEDKFEEVKIKNFDVIEEVKEEESIGSINTLDEEKFKEELLNSNKIDRRKLLEGKIKARLNSERKMELDEKDNLKEVFDDINNVLKEDINIQKSIDQIYEKYLENHFISKTHIKKQIGDCFLKFIFFIIGPTFGIIFLIGIFQMKSLMNSLGDLISTSFVDYYKCNFYRSNCNYTSINDENNVYNFYDYYYNYSMNETIDFNLMLLTGFIGSLFLGWVGFRFSIFIFLIINISSIIWLLNLDFEFKAEVVFILKILNFCFIYVLLFIGIGGSALLSHQILIESHLKYKKYLKDKREEERIKEEEKRKEEIKNLYDIDLSLDKKSRLQKSTGIFFKKKNVLDENKKKIKSTKTLMLSQKPKDLAIKIGIEQQRQKIKEDMFDKRDKNKFDFFFMICLTTMIGYLGKYSINILLDFILSHIYNTKNYDKKSFMVSLLILYGSSIVLTFIFYNIFKYSIFEYDEKENDDNNKKNIKISKICGYIIYSEKKKPKVPPKRNCCTLLCCENIQNCCEVTCCNILRKYDLFDLWPQCSPHCCCKKCEYDPEDYNKNQEDFRYCYKTQRKSFWCNKFMASKTQENIFPKMLQYFILQLTTIGFEK